MMQANIKLVLCASAKGLLAGVWRAGKLQGSQRFASDADGQHAFAEFLALYAQAPVYLIADAVEEDYRLESLPHTTGSAKNELLNRKLNQHYRGLDYRTAHFITRDTDKRKDDKYLFAALNNDDFMQDWVSIIRTAEAKLVGVYLLPMLSQILANQLKIHTPHVLLCEKLASGLRQTYLQDGRLRMSRLVPSLPEAASQLNYFYLVETEKTRLYLMSQRFITRDTPLKLVLVSAEGDTQAISQSISSEQGVECENIALTELSQQLGLSQALVQQAPDLIHMQLLAKGHTLDNLAPEALTKPFQLSKIKRAIQLATIAIGAMGMLTAAWLAKAGLDAKTAQDEAMQDTAIQQHRYDEVAKNFPNTPISANDLQIAVELDQRISQYPKTPKRMMQVLSKALEASKNLDHIQLDRMRWVLNPDSNVKDEDKSLPIASTNAVANTANPALPSEPNTLYEIGFITAEITGFTGDYRSALNTVNQYVTNLKADSRVALIEVVQEPVNVSSFADLQGSTTDEQSTQKQPAMFKLKVVLNPVAAAEVKQP